MRLFVAKLLQLGMALLFPGSNKAYMRQGCSGTLYALWLAAGQAVQNMVLVAFLVHNVAVEMLSGHKAGLPSGRYWRFMCWRHSDLLCTGLNWHVAMLYIYQSCVSLPFAL